MKKIAKATAVLGAIFGSGALAVALAACVDGTTPDCSDPDAGCNPSAVEDASTAADGEAGDATIDGDAAPSADTGAADTAPSGDDASTDADSSD